MSFSKDMPVSVRENTVAIVAGVRFCYGAATAVGGAGLLLALFAASCGPHSDREAEARFQERFGPTLTKSLVLVTNKHQYHRDEIITFWVENRTGTTIWFQDQWFGVEACAYDNQDRQWVDVDLGSYPVSPVPTAVEPWPPAVVDASSLVIEYIDLPQPGEIRLVVTGHTELTNPVRDRAYMAYTDIRIVD